ncbi:carboxylate-amine ligase [Streptomyces natalensis]|uniref:carboxylate-amine ligase n=1 Tax=Streptomyces natalensis TaxID=68242 RepID=UPI001F529A0C|nr:glutamate--cysteine ligase [Streptomyces natalensis]
MPSPDHGAAETGKAAAPQVRPAQHVPAMAYGPDPAAKDTGMTRGEKGPTMGVEEEYFLIDPASRTVVPAGSLVLRRAADILCDRVSGELTEYQFEAKTPPCTGLDALRAQLAGIRTAVVAAAAAEGLGVAASGTPVLAAHGPAPIRDDPAYRPGLDAYRALNDTYALCALHTHVQVPDLDHAVLVCNHLRPWLPLLVALSANSPFWEGRDTGYASWRTVAGGQWPVAGPPPYFTSADHYKQLCATLTETGAAVGDHTLLWDVRPSAHLPTVEIRVMDVPTRLEETAALAALVRALVARALERVTGGDPGPQVCPALLRAAYWRSARDGCSGDALDLRSGALVPVSRLVRDLVDHARPALDEYGELAPVTAVLGELTGRGGAERQRAAFARRSRPADVVDELIRQTASVPAVQEAGGMAAAGGAGLSCT